MGNRLFVGNLPYSSTEEEVRDLFAARWGVVDVRVVTDRETGRSRGFAFVELDSSEAAAAAIAEMDGQSLGGRPLAVREAHDRKGGGRPRRSPRGGDVPVDAAPRRGGGFRGPPPRRGGNGGAAFGRGPEPGFAPPPWDAAAPQDLDEGKKRRRERRRNKKRRDGFED